MKVAVISSYPPERCGVADYAAGYAHEIEKTLQVDRVRVPLEGWSPLPHIRAALRSRKSDIVHVQYEPSLYGRLGASGIYTPLLYLLLMGKRKVTTVHEVAAGSTPVRKIYYTIMYRSLAHSDAIIVHTQGSIIRLGGYLKQRDLAKFRVVPLPAFPTAHAPGTGEAKELLGLADKKVLLVFGYLVENKGHKLAIDALHGMPKDVILMIAGGARNPREADYEKNLRDYAREKGLYDRVLFAGRIPEEDVPGVFAAADAVLMPYTSVTQSGVIMQALAYGRPVVASDVDGLLEVSMGCKAVHTFKMGDETALRTKTMEVLDNPGTGAKEYAERLDVTVTTQRLINIYKEIAHDKTN